MSCDDYLALSPYARLNLISEMAPSRGLPDKERVLISWERTALAQCEINRRSVGQYVGEASGLAPDTPDPAAIGAGAEYKPE